MFCKSNLTIGAKELYLAVVKRLKITITKIIFVIIDFFIKGFGYQATKLYATMPRILSLMFHKMINLMRFFMFNIDMNQQIW